MLLLIMACIETYILESKYSTYGGGMAKDILTSTVDNYKNVLTKEYNTNYGEIARSDWLI